MMYLHLYSFLYTVYFGVVTSRKSSLLYVQTRYFSKRKLVKTLLHTQLKQTNLKNRFHISTENLQEGFNDTDFQHFVD